ncbi:MAG: addiction module protein [Burkholderiales bacterium]
MTTALTELEERVRALSGAEKRQLLAQLVAELDDEEGKATDAEIDAAWAEEAKRRLTEIRDGSVKSIPAEQVFAEAKAHLR